MMAVLAKLAPAIVARREIPVNSTSAALIVKVLWPEAAHVLQEAKHDDIWPSPMNLLIDETIISLASA